MLTLSFYFYRKTLDRVITKNQKNDRELKEEMITFLGFGLRLSIKGVEETLKENDSSKKKSALRLQFGFQMLKYIN